MKYHSKIHVVIHPSVKASLGILDLGLVHPLPYQNSDNLVIVLVKNIKVHCNYNLNYKGYYSGYKCGGKMNTNIVGELYIWLK